VAAKNDASYDLSGARACVTGQTTIAPSTATTSLPNGRIVTALLPAPCYGDSGVLTAYAVAVGLGRLTTEGWSIDTTGAMQIVADTVLPHGYRTLTSLTFVVPYKPGTDLSRRWIFFQLSAIHRGIFQLAPGKRFYNYACIPLNVLGATAESEDPAARMKANYTKAC
jgi:hypothetical protein